MGFLRALSRKTIGPMTGPEGTVQRNLIDAWMSLNDASHARDQDRANEAHIRLLALGKLYAPDVLAAHLALLAAADNGQPVFKDSPWQERLKAAVYMASKPPYEMADPALIDREIARAKAIFSEGG